jgi:hypothetical protein
VTVQDVIDQALEALGVIAPGETPSTEERDRGLSIFSQLVANWNDILKRVLAGSFASDYYTFTALPTYASLADNITLSAGWQRAFVFALAVDLAPYFGRTVPPEVAAMCEKAKAAIVALPTPVL